MKNWMKTPSKYCTLCLLSLLYYFVKVSYILLWYFHLHMYLLIIKLLINSVISYFCVKLGEIFNYTHWNTATSSYIKQLIILHCTTKPHNTWKWFFVNKYLSINFLMFKSRVTTGVIGSFTKKIIRVEYHLKIYVPILKYTNYYVFY